MKKISIILIFFVMLPFFIFAEGQDEDIVTPTAPIPKIKAVLDVVVKVHDDQAAWAAKYKKLTGIELEILQPTHNKYEEKLKIMIAGGDIPDIFETMPTFASLYAKEGAAVALDGFIAANPNLASVPKRLLDSYRSQDGKLYFFPLQLGGGCVGYIRKDWLDKLGLSIPTTYDELVNVMEAFTKRDPDGDGQANTYGYSATLMGDGIFQDMYNRNIMLDAKGNFFVKNGKWVDGFAQPEMKEALARWQKLYKAGIIDPEIFTNQTSDMREKFFQGRTGIVEYWVASWAFKMQRDTHAASGPNAVVKPFAPVKGAKYLDRLARVFCISTKTKNPKAVFDNWIGLMWDQGPGQELFVYGVEGIHHKKLGGNKVEFLPSPANPKIRLSKIYVEEFYQINDGDIRSKQDAITDEATRIWQKNSEPLSLEAGGDVYNRYIGEIHNLRLEIFSKVTKGDMSPDEGMREYIRKSKNFQVDQMIRELGGK
ncbi:MAG: extracellular solute-binding protein [Spirochaetales bacterium]|nr:extracellular solute-binding protein [Spirochaetales bacterium]